MKKILYVLLFFVTSCQNGGGDKGIDKKQDCNQLPEVFGSYNEAMQLVEQADFALKEDVNTAKSSWIRGARFYSCDEQTGYFIIVTDKGIYIHHEVPVSVWEAFKAANSFGSFYNENIKHEYRLTPK